MIVCPNCAWANEVGSRFCENCGADLRNLVGAQPPVAGAPDPWAPWDVQANQGSAAPPVPAPGWVGEPPAVEEKSEGRRWWLWAIVGLIAALLLVCIGFTLWISLTESGADFLTRVAEEGTKRAGEE